MTIQEVNQKYGSNIPEILAPGEAGNPEKWEAEGRARLKAILQREEYGLYPDYDKKNTTFKIIEDCPVLGKPIHRRMIDITTNHGGRSHTFTAYLFTPEGAENVPCFLYICRHSWMARSVWRGILHENFPFEEICRRGYGVIYYDTDSIAQENLDDFEDYKRGLFQTLAIDKSRGDDLGAIGLWAFGAMRVLDYLETDPAVDATKVAVLGHSRLGKTALLAGAMDERFALTISNSSGAGGAALFKIKVGEHVDYMAETIPYWFCQNYTKYVNAEDKMAFDQHFLLSLVAPRSLYVQSSELDEWADPNAEFTAAALASQVWEQVYGIPGLVHEGFPAVDTPLHKGSIGYHVRTGDHYILRWDWDAYMDFADKQFGKK